MSVRVVHQEITRWLGDTLPVEGRTQVNPVECDGRFADPSDAQDCRQQVVDGADPVGDRADGDRRALLVDVTGVCLRPGSDEWYPHAAFVVGTFLATQRRGDSRRFRGPG